VPHWLWLYYDEREIAPFVYSPPPKMTFRARVRAFFKKEGSGTIWYTRCQLCGSSPSGQFAGIIDEGLCRTCRTQRAWCQEVLDIRHWAQRMLQDEQAVLLDTETTGLGKRDVVIELALLSVSDKRMLYHSLIRPNRSIPWAASSRNSLWDEQMRSAPTFERVWRDVLPILANCSTVISYNAAFHRSRLAWTAQQYGYQLPPLTWECLMTRYATFYGYPRSVHAMSYLYQSLDNACRQQNTTRSVVHNASEHVKAARRLLYALAEKEGQHWDASR
jgi:DNA polymerase-3 subunit epsilon